MTSYYVLVDELKEASGLYDHYKTQVNTLFFLHSQPQLKIFRKLRGEWLKKKKQLQLEIDLHPDNPINKLPK